ncbi:hypothetical protein JQK19_20720 [Chromobacterium violaceum]|uniref:hypothetical protein n=1 Tax=Chromobacterium violaceum TaxID=536 RepID=UPI001BE787C5|nr:hypothetical protein [Chromobacterium violaceum]MBT2869657.1 hypothetical protein [Chromobacterium violaceum]
MTFATSYAASSPLVCNPDYDSYVDRKAGQGDAIMSQGISVLYKFMTLFNDLAQGKYDQMSAKADRARDSQQAANQVDSILSQLKEAGDRSRLPPEVIDYMRQKNIQVDGKSIDDFLKDSNPAQPFLDKLRDKIAEAGPEGMRSDSWQDVVSYMDQQGIKVDGQKCADYIWGLPEVGQKSYQNISRDHMQHIADVLAGATEGLDKGQLDQIKSALDTDSGKCSDFVTQAQLQIQKTMQSYNVCVSLINSMSSLLAEMNKSISQNIR